MNKTASRIVPLETAQKGDMVELELGVPWPRDAKKEKVTGKVMLVKKDGTIVINVEKSRQNPGGHPNEDVGYVERARPAAKTAADDKLTQKDLLDLLKRTNAERTLDNTDNWKAEIGGFKLWVGGPGGSRSRQYEYDVRDSRNHAVQGKVKNFPGLAKALADAIGSLLDKLDKTAAGDEPTLSRFEEGQDADPTENMSEEDAKKWRLNTLIHKDKFTEGDKDSKKACLLKLNLK